MRRHGSSIGPDGMISTVESFPGEGVELTRLLVVSDLGRSRDWYEHVLGAMVYREYGGSSCMLRLLGSWPLLVTGGGPTDDKPTVRSRHRMMLTG
jgi:hypothetical protein